MKTILVKILLLISFAVLGQDNSNISGGLDNFPDSEQILFSTVKIEVYSKKDKPNVKIDTSSGTSFVFSYQIDSVNTLPVLVTNKHVIEGGSSFALTFTRKLKNGSPDFGNTDRLIADANDKNILWYFHDNKEIDLAITPLIPLLSKLPKGIYEYAFNSILEGDIPLEKELEVLKGVEDILMIGYPIGIWDSSNNMPITRKGVTASSPLLDYKGKSEFVIDAACFPGSSGSPVMIINEGMYSTKFGIFTGRRRLFMGILYGGPIYEPSGQVKIIDIPTRKDAINLSQIPINLGYVIKSKHLLDFKVKLGI